ncbi:MAG: ATP-binding cassette domain-containing protein [Rikenellaceae bacterium]
MIKINNVTKQFDASRKVLDSVSAQFESGKTNLIIGQSGSGKTVLLKSLVGLHEINEGEIFYDDVCYSKLTEKEKKDIRTKVGMIFQGGALFDSLTVEENVRFPLDIFTELSLAEKTEKAQACLERVNLSHARDLYPAEISGGMVKRTSIARAIVNNPRYLFCDEPNSGLDPKTSIVIDDLIKEITIEYNITTIINTHDMNSVMQIGDKVVFIHQGKKWWEGNKDSILHSDNQELNEFVFASEMAKLAKKSMNR